MKSRAKRIPPAPRALPFDLSDAVFLDFETYGGGERGTRPVLASVLDMRSAGAAAAARDGARALMASPALRTFVLDPRLASAARHRKLGLLLPTAFSRWLTKWQAHGRPIVGFSSHDHAVLLAYQPESVIRYENMLPHARRWRSRHHSDAVRQYKEAIEGLTARQRRTMRHEFNSLTALLRLARIGVPRRYGKGKVTTWVRQLEAHLERHGDYARVPKGARAKWVRVIRHNRFDVAALAELAITVSGECRRASRAATRQ